MQGPPSMGWGVVCIVRPWVECVLSAHSGSSGLKRGVLPMHFLRTTFAIIGLCGPLGCLAQSGIYSFIDGEGYLYLTNVPDSERYKRLEVGSGASGDGASYRQSGTASAAATGAMVAREAPANDGGVNAGLRRPYGTEIARAAGRYGIEAALLHAVISVESGYNAKAVSKRGAAGLMQLMPGTARRYGVVDIFDPGDNVDAGAQYLTSLLKLFDNDLGLALAAYNAGEAAVMKYGRRIPPYRETASYVPKVVAFYQQLRLMM